MTTFFLGRSQGTIDNQEQEWVKKWGILKTLNRSLLNYPHLMHGAIGKKGSDRLIKTEKEFPIVSPCDRFQALKT